MTNLTPALGTIVDGRAVRFERLLSGPIERVWDYLTNPERLPEWFHAGSVASKVGGNVGFAMGVEGRVTVYEPPRVLEYTWNETDAPCGPIRGALVRWELTAQGDQVRLILVHSRLLKGALTMLGAGWQTFLDRLAARLCGRSPGSIETAYAALEPVYKARVSIDSETKPDFRAPARSKRVPRAVADGAGGTIIAVAEVAGPPERAFNALTTSEVEHWWKWPGQYHQKDWKADVRVCGPWSVTVELVDGTQVRAWGEFCELSFPNKLVMTRRFDAHPFLGERETTITYRFEPSAHGTLVTVKDEGFIGRAEAAHGNAEIWEKVLGWLDAHLSSR